MCKRIFLVILFLGCSSDKLTNSISGNTDFQTIMQTDEIGTALGIIGSGTPSGCYSQDFYRSNEDISLPPVETSILYPYPNPFNPSTSISFDLDSESYVTIFIIDENEETIKTLVDSEWINAGLSTTYQWNGTDNNGEYVESGYYRVIIDFGDYECFANLHLYII